MAKFITLDNLFRFKKNIDNIIPTKTSELENDSDFAVKNDIPTKTSQLTNNSNFATKSELPDIRNLADRSELPTKVSELENDSGFITISEIPVEYAKQSDIPNKTSQLTNDSNFLSSIPSEYVTDTELMNKNYATNATVNEVRNSIPTKTSELTNDSDFVTTSALPTKVSQLENDSNFTTRSDIPDISSLADKSDIPTKTSELTHDSNFATKDEIPDISNLASKDEIPDISNLADKSDIPTKTSELTNDSNFATQSDIPDISNLASKVEIPDISNLADKSEIPTKTSQLENDSKFITNSEGAFDYDNLANKPNLPEGARLYDIPGQNTDGAMTQKAATDSFATKDEIPDISNLASKVEIPDISNLASKDEIPTNYVTTDTEQTITGKKHFDGGLVCKQISLSDDSVNSGAIVVGENNRSVLYATDSSDYITLGNSSFQLYLQGLLARPLYNNNPLGLLSDIPDTSNFVTTDTEQTITAIKTLANDADILNQDGHNILKVTDIDVHINNILKELRLYSNGRPYVHDGQQQQMAYLSDIPTLSTTTSGTFGSIFQASMSLGGLTIKFGLNGLTPNKETVTTKTITFDEPFKEYCAATISGCSSASTLRTTNLNAEITKTGLTAAIYRTNTTYTYFSWIAVGV